MSSTTPYTARKTVFSAYGATNSAWQVRDAGGNAVRVRMRGREVSLIFKHHIAAAAAVDLLNAGQQPAAALSVGRRTDQVCYAQAEAPRVGG